MYDSDVLRANDALLGDFQRFEVTLCTLTDLEHSKMKALRSIETSGSPYSAMTLELQYTGMPEHNAVKTSKTLTKIRKAPYTLSVQLSDFSVTSYLTEKLSKLCSSDRQWRRPQNCPFHSSFTQRTAQFTQGIPQFPQFTY
jgi:hypothetical protein